MRQGSFSERYMRFYVPPESIFPEKNTIEIKDKKEIHHIRDVMRLKIGDSVDIFDGRAKEYRGTIEKINKNSVILGIKKGIDFKGGLPYKLTLYQAIPKKNKMDFIVEKAVELGVERIVPMLTERTVPAIKDKSHKRIQRWRRIIKAASKQSGRVRMPIISDVTDFNNALIESKKMDLVIFAALDKDAKPLKEILKTSRPKRIAVFIGPEGDFSQNEISMANREGYTICSLGPLVLRIETAAIHVLSCLNYEYTN